MAYQQDPGEVGRRPSWKTWVVVAVFLLLVIFVAQNSQEVEIDFLFFTKINTPLIVALVISAVLGALIGWLAPRVRRRD